MKKKQIVSKLIALSLSCGVIASTSTSAFAATTTTTTTTAVVQQSVPVKNATNAVVKAEITKLKINVDKAQTLINALPSGSDKTSLQTRLNIVQKYLSDVTTATQAVVKAETTKTQTDVNSAKVLVNALDNSNLDIRLSNVQDYINDVSAATGNVLKTETDKLKIDANKLKAEVATAQTAVSVLPNGTVRTALQTRLDVVKKYLSDVNIATNAVVKAEISNASADVTKAQTLVSALPNGVDKTSLQNRINDIKGSLSASDAATNAVVKAEQSKLQTDVDSAQALLDKLPSSNTNLQTRLNAVKKYISDVAAATNAVTKVEANKLSADNILLDIKVAQPLINVLPKGTVRTNLQDRINTVLAYTNSVKVATNAVVRAEITNVQTDIDKAVTLVSALPSGVDKTSLQGRLNAISNENTVLATATKAVEKAEGSNLQSDVNNAQVLLSTLPTSNANLQTRLNLVQKYIDGLTAATQAVVSAETSKVQTDKDKAQTLVNAITSGLYATQKAALQGRLDAVQQYINDGNDAAYSAVKDKILNPTTPVDGSQTTTVQPTV